VIAVVSELYYLNQIEFLWFDKSQITSTKSQINSKLQYSMTKTDRRWE
jgi:hypothetical protein